MPSVESRFPIAANSPSPTDLQRALSAGLQDTVISLAKDIEAATTPGRWQSLALTSLEETLMWANKALFNPEK